MGNIIDDISILALAYMDLRDAVEGLLDLMTIKIKDALKTIESHNEYITLIKIKYKENKSNIKKQIFYILVNRKPCNAYPP